MRTLDLQTKQMSVSAAEWQLRRNLIESNTIEKVIEYARTDKYPNAAG